MCSIEEAWGNITFTQNKSGVTNNLVQQQMLMNQERQPDVAGQLYTQTDDRRQWAMPENDVFYDDLDKGLMAKPASEANGISRGVHSKYSRVKRFESRTEGANGVMGKLVTDVDPKYYERTQPTDIPKPEYLALYERPFVEIGGVAVPLPSNTNNEQFSTVQPRAMNKFTPEIITDPSILAEAEIASRTDNHTVKPIRDAQQNDNKTVKVPAEDKRTDMLAMQVKALVSKVDKLEKKMTMVEHDKSHDMVLFIVLAIFVMFILDNVFNKKIFG
jgi:hypothetical protein